MDEQKQVPCTGVTKLTLSNGNVSMDFSNKQVGNLPSKDGEFLTLSIPLYGFLHMAACINQMIDRMKENGIILESSKKPVVESSSKTIQKTANKMAKKSSVSAKSGTASASKKKETPRRKIERKNTTKSDS